jgi:queuine tRNA-ribosyltransferase
MRDIATGELMHPIVGPLVEAEELYILPSRLEERLRGGGAPAAGALVLLDVGLGAGSNAVAAWKLSERMPDDARRLEIVSFENSLAAIELALTDEHALSFGFEEGVRQAARALLAKGRHETPRTLWRLVLGDLPSTLTQEPESSADMVFWDLFSPRANPTLWTVEAFATLRPLCRAGANVYTYSAATATRSGLLLAGFAVGAGDAKRSAGKGTTHATVDLHDLARPLDARWLDRLRRSSAPFPPDAPPDALLRIASLPQFSAAS